MKYEIGYIGYAEANEDDYEVDNAIDVAERWVNDRNDLDHIANDVYSTII